MIKSVLILDEFFAITAKIRTLFLSHIKITNYLTLKHGTFNLRPFELYERRWGIEVIFKECRGYLGLGKCQSRSYNAQIADTTLCFMMYQMLSLAKRFSEYETLGALFRSERDRLQVLTLWSRTLEEVRHLLEVLSREAGVDLLTCLSTVAAR